MRHWQGMFLTSKWKLRDVISTVTLLPYSFSMRVSGMHTLSQQKCMKRIPTQDLIIGHQTGGEPEYSTIGYGLVIP